MRVRADRQWIVGAVAAIVAAAVLSLPVAAVPLDDENPITIALDDGTQVTLLPVASPLSEAPAGPRAPLGPKLVAVGKAGQAMKQARDLHTSVLVARNLALAGNGPGQPTTYYYLPTNLRLARRADGTPEFLFLMYTTEKTVEQGGAQGGLLHFLMEWGLTKAQEDELRTKLKARATGAELAGPAPLEYQGENGSFQIISAVLGDTGDKGMTASVITSGKAPLVPGARCAAAAKLDANGAQLLGATFKQGSAITDISVALNLAYTTLAPAAKGTITFHWSKLAREYDSLSADYKRWESGRSESSFGFGILDTFGVDLFSTSSPEYSYTYDQMHEHYEYLLEKNVVELHFDELVADERVAKIRDAFFDYFLKSIAEPAAPDAPAPPVADKDKDKQNSPDIRTGDSYHFNQTSIKQVMAQKDKTLTLNYRMAIKRPISVVANMASWYDAVRDNPKCVATVNLNDPFFQHRDINFILDLDAKEMFDEAVNYVTVNVRKQRDKGNPFTDSVTMDANYIKQHGITATVTYARGEDSNPDVYEYQAQWSLKGGTVFPLNPPWQKGNWEGVTLAPPVVPRTIELEANLDDMKASGITRATAQVRYLKFGEEAEDNLQVSPAGAQPLVSHKIFTDRGTKGYVYRLILNHKTEGKLVLPWSAKIGDDYIYATIPEDLLKQPEYKEAGKQLETTAGTEKVLDRFKDLIGGGR